MAAGGSSSGSAVALSAGFAPLSLGTETGGSTVFPASKAGLYAIRPTHGFVSTKGVFRISISYDGIGAMAKTPEDLAVLTEVILLPEFRAKLPKYGYKGSMLGKWEGLKVGVLDLGWSGPDEGHRKKWGSEAVVCYFFRF